MLNINVGHNRKLLEKCRALYEYAAFVEKVREYSVQMDIKSAVNKAVDEAIALNYLDGFFKRHRGGIVNMNLTEYNEEEFVANRRAEGREEGREEGAFGIIKILRKRKESDSNILQELVSCLSISLEQAKKYLNSYQEI